MPKKKLDFMQQAVALGEKFTGEKLNPSVRPSIKPKKAKPSKQLTGPELVAILLQRRKEITGKAENPISVRNVRHKNQTRRTNRAAL